MSKTLNGRGRKRIEMGGQRSGRLVVVRPSHQDTNNNRWFWICLCDCGAETIVNGYSLRSCVTRSCGCIRAEQIGRLRRTHGQSETVEYKTWRQMRGRCNNPRSKDYSFYGGRGISVCSEWSDSFKAFYRDMGPRPSAQHTIDRIDNDGNYEPGNCRWATRKQQSRNTRYNRRITFRGITLCTAEWAEKTGITPGMLRDRLDRGWAVERVLMAEPGADR